jgi:hypothetical protein
MHAHVHQVDARIKALDGKHCLPDDAVTHTFNEEMTREVARYRVIMCHDCTIAHQLSISEERILTLK